MTLDIWPSRVTEVRQCNEVFDVILDIIDERVPGFLLEEKLQLDEDRTLVVLLELGTDIHTGKSLLLQVDHHLNAGYFGSGVHLTIHAVELKNPGQELGELSPSDTITIVDALARAIRTHPQLEIVEL